MEINKGLIAASSAPLVPAISPTRRRAGQHADPPGLAAGHRAARGAGARPGSEAGAVMMSAEDVHEVLDCLARAGVPVWVDGGWGIDALTGAQHRPHDDLDLVVPHDRADEVRAALARLGFAPHIDWGVTRFVLRDVADRRVDFHPVTFDTTGAATQELQDGRLCLYPAEGFTGTGTIGGRPVRCLTAAVQALHHLGYEPQEKDRHDLRLLRDHLGLELPAPYRED